MNQNTARMLKGYAVSMFKAGDRVKYPEAVDALYQWAKRWWTGLDHRRRGEAGRRMRAGLLPLPEHFVGAPAFVGRLRAQGTTWFDSPVPKVRRRFVEADRRRARRLKRKKREKGGG